MADRVRVIIEGVDEASKVLSGIRKESEEFHNSLRNIGLGLSAVGASITGVLGLSVKASSEQQQATETLAAAMRTTGTFTEEVLQRQLEFASALQRTTAFSDDAITRMQAMLVNLGRLSGPALEQATRATLGFAAVLGVDLDTAARQVSQVLNGASSSVGRFNLQLSAGASLHERFNAVVQTGTSFLTTAEAQAATFQGRLIQFKNAVNDLGESVGSVLLPALMSLLRAATQAIEKVSDFAKANPQLTATLVKLAAALAAVLLILGPLLIALPQLVAGWKILAPAIGAVLVSVGPLALAFGALVFAMTRTEEGARALIGTFDALMAVATMLGEVIIGLGAIMLEALVRPVEFVFSLLSNLPGRMGEAFQSTLEQVRGFREELDLTLAGVGESLTQSFSDIGAAFQGEGSLGSVFGSLSSGGGAGSPFQQMRQDAEESLNAIGVAVSGLQSGFQRFLDQTKQKWGQDFGHLRNVTENFVQVSATAISSQLGTAIGDIILGTKSASEAFKEFGRAIIEAIVRFFAEYAAQLLVAKALSFLFTTFISTTAAAIANAWLPAAVLATIATLGAAAAQAPVTITGALGVTKGVVAAVTQGLGTPTGLAEGGIVTEPTLALIGEAGPEAVVPLDTAGGFGETIVNVTVQVDKALLNSAENIDEFATLLARKIGRIVDIRQMMPAGVQR